jgi:four helix bundle protein
MLRSPRAPVKGETVQTSQTSLWFSCLVSAGDTMRCSYRDLIVWQKATAMVTDIYRSTQSFPREEMFGFTSQLRRSAVSVASNIAEGQGRLSKGEFRQFLGQARGSLIELETQLYIGGNLGYLNPEAVTRLLERSGEVSCLLHGLIKSQPTEAKARARD